MKTRRSLDFDGLDGILQTQNAGYQKHHWAKRLWWLLLIPIAVAAIFLSTNDRKVATAKSAAPQTQIAPTQKSAPISSNDPSQLQATENKNLSDNVMGDPESDQLAAQASHSAQKAIATEPTASQLSDAKASQPPAEILYTVQFNLDSSKLSLMTPAEIEAIVTAAKRCPSQIKLTGHTCNLGSAPANKALGLTRANRVKKLLSNNGIEPKRIITLSDGMENPIANNDTREGRKLNRRVDLTCLDQ